MGPRRLGLVAVTAAAALCLLRPSRGADPMVRARAGGVAELGCSLDPPPSGPASRLFPLHVVEWVRLGYSVPILIKFGVYTPRVHPDYRGRVSLSRGASLLLRGLRLEDEGWFECRILLLDRATDEFRNGTWTFLSVTAPPTFLKTPPPFLEALLGDSVTLVCVAHGNPQPSVTWKKDDAPVEKQETVELANGTLTLASVTREEAGTYKCHVSNAEGNLTHATQLLVKGPPIIIISPEDATLNMSQDAVLQCQAEAYPANLSYMWWREGEDVHHIESLKFRVKVLVDGSLLIPSLVPEDAGNYTCMPSNGLLTPPTASAYLTVRHPAQVMRMPRETYLPAGMGGVITCPIRADPPMLYVNWTKDGDVLNLDMFPGWMVNSEGSVFIATANDDAVGVYTCTAYNSYGTMGESDPTSVLLQDPPSFKVVPRAEYLQEVGRELVVPCQARGDPAPNTTWSKVGSAPRSSYTVAANGSLVLRPLSKDHQGAWECQATNRVATVSTSTMVLVLGTSPHAVLAVSVVPEVNQLNVSWEPGFDGGYTQKFTVWVKQASRDNHEWTTLPVPPSKSSLLVTGLLPGTKYQLSVLPQNKLGSGPFSEIATVRTLVPPTALVPTAVPKLAPPSQLSVNQTSEGIVVQWAWPPPQAPPITGFVLQARQQRGQWQVLDGAVGRNSSEVLVQGLLKDSIYELRLLSVSDNVISEPSESVSVSTAGMEVYPARRGLLHFIPEPLLAGVVGGVCFLFVAILLSLAMACIMGHRREQRRRKRRDDLPTALQKSPPPQARSPPDSPDSILKMKLCPPLSFFPGSSSSQSDRSSFDKASRSEYQDQRQQLLTSCSPPPRYTLFESHLGGLPSPTAALESISRGPDGRFAVQPYEEERTTAHVQKNLKKEFPQCTTGGSGSSSSKSSFRDSPRSNSLCSDKDGKRDIAEIVVQRQTRQSPQQNKVRAKKLSPRGCFYSDDERGCSDRLLDRASFCSDSGEKRARDSLKRYRSLGCQGDLFPPLRRQAKEEGLGQDRMRYSPSSYLPVRRENRGTGSGTTMFQMENERESDSLSKCLKLAQEREQMEKELERFTSSQRTRGRAREQVQVKENPAGRDEEDPVWKLQDVPLRQKSQQASGQPHRLSDYRKGCYFGNTSSPMEQISSPYMHWDISPVDSITSLVAVQSPLEKVPPRAPMVSPAETALAVDCSPSPTTQCSSLSLPSAAPGTSFMSPGDLKEAKSRRPEKSLLQQSFSHGRSLPEESWAAERSRSEGTFLSEGANDRRASPALSSAPVFNVLQMERKQESEVKSAVRATEAMKGCQWKRRSADRCDSIAQNLVEGGGKDRDSPSGGSTLPYDFWKSGERKGAAVSHSGSSPVSPEFEKEGVRIRSRKSDKCLYGDSPGRVSPLAFTENEAESDPSHFSVLKMSESFKAEIVPQAPKKPLLQTSAILEYLSLPGFIEMSVDEPAGENEASGSIQRSSEQGLLLREKPDVLPKDWEAHKPETKSSQKSAEVLENKPPSGDSGLHGRPSSKLKAEDSRGKGENPDKGQEPSHSLEELQQHHGDESQPICADASSGSEVRWAINNLGVSLVPPSSALKQEAGNATRKSASSTDRREAAFESSQRLEGSRNSKAYSRLYQAPTSFMKKSASVGPSRSLWAVAQPGPPLKKSVSLGSQRWEHYKMPQSHTSDRLHCDDFPQPNVLMKSSSISPASPFCPRQGYDTFRPQSSPDVESAARTSRFSGVPYRLGVQPSTKDLLKRPDHPVLARAPTSTRRLSPDPRRQATAFPEVSCRPAMYQEALRSVQHIAVPRDHYGLQVPQRPGTRGVYVQPLDSRSGAQRVSLPRGYSWPSPYHPHLVPRETATEGFREKDVWRGTEPEVRDCRDATEGRASYASQSSGRGSMGPSYPHGLLRQSLSLTPTLTSSPETVQEMRRHSTEADAVRRRADKRNTYVDESYEWDQADVPVDLYILEEESVDHEGPARRDRPHSAIGLGDLQSKGLFSWASAPPVFAPQTGLYGRSLSEARFNALRLEYQEYRRAQECARSHRSRPTPNPDSDPDSNAALL
ncbi:uncharacterized protein igsf9b [Scleropages formosus]|uniref:uncharacterized protein igsf9b n=1 Tax=Scleropages formosus TaxID=113540 RepID=UPI0010FA6C41|nr:uncharacterized protein LOC108921823 [Scleropages formosus]